MLKNFKTYQLAVQHYRYCLQLKLPSHLRDQLLRASSSVVLNIAEGSAKPTKRDQMKYYAIALGSLRECQAVLDLNPRNCSELAVCADQLGACLYRLCHPN
jgi:four helix bundle protein